MFVFGPSRFQKDSNEGNTSWWRRVNEAFWSGAPPADFGLCPLLLRAALESPLLSFTCVWSLTAFEIRLGCIDLLRLSL